MDVLYDYLSAKFRRRLPLRFVYINTKHSFNTINGRQCAEPSNLQKRDPCQSGMLLVNNSLFS